MRFQCNTLLIYNVFWISVAAMDDGISDIAKCFNSWHYNFLLWSGIVTLKLKIYLFINYEKYPRLVQKDLEACVKDKGDKN